MSDKMALKLWLHLARAHAALRSEINARLKQKYGQSLARFDVLAQLARVPDQALPVGILSAALIAPSGNISRLLDRMQAEELLRRIRGRDDRRKVSVCLTKRGAALFAQMAHDHEAWIKDMLCLLPPAEQRGLVQNLQNLQNAQKALAARPGHQRQSQNPPAS